MMEGEIPELLKPISWLLGNWMSSELGSGEFPNISPFQYKEKIEFKLCGGQPLLAYNGHSSNPTKGNPMHLEAGFLRSTGNNHFSFMVAHNFGVTSIEEGSLEGNKLVLKSIALNRMTTAKDPQVLQTQRIFHRMDDGKIVQEFSMATTKIPELTHHLRVQYNSV